MTDWLRVGLDAGPMLWWGGLAVLLGLVMGLPPVIRGRAWAQRRPRLSLGLWTGWGIGAAAVLVVLPLSVLAAVSFSTVPGPVRDLSRWLLPSVQVAGAPAVAAFVALVLLGSWVGLRVLHTAVSRRRAATEHLQIVDLVGRWDPHSKVVVLDSDSLAAYCVSDLWRSTVVVTRGALARVAPTELTAVLEHERAHARGRHAAVVTAFVAWQQVVPFSRAARSAVEAVQLATEMLADDAAVRAVGGPATLRALHHLDRGHSADGPTVWAPGPVTLARVRRLLA